MAHDFCKRANSRIINVCHLKFCRILFIACTHTADDRHSTFLCLFYDLKLRCHSINCIDYVGVFAEIEFPGSLRKIETFTDVYFCIRINFMDSVRHNIRLVLSDCFSCGYDLTIQIRKADFVVIHKYERTDTAPGKSLYCISTNAADAENRDFCTV